MSLLSPPGREKSLIVPPTPPQPSGRVFLVSIPQEKGGGNYDNLNNESKNFRLLKNWDSLYAEQELWGTDFDTGTTSKHHSGTTVHQQEPVSLFPHFYLIASR